MTTTVCPVCGVVRDSRIKGTCICGYNENPKKMTLAELADAQAKNETLLKVLRAAWQKQVDELEAENGRLRAQFAEVDTQLAERDALLDGRAGKLLRKGKHFVVVAEDEPYYPSVYACIRQAEKAKGTWTDVCEAEYQKHVHSGHFGDPRTMTLACQLADAQAILVRLADDALAISIAHTCCDPHHDGRWCPTCDARSAGIEAYREALREKGD